MSYGPRITVSGGLTLTAAPPPLFAHGHHVALRVAVTTAFDPTAWTGSARGPFAGGPASPDGA